MKRLKNQARKGTDWTNKTTASGFPVTELKVANDILSVTVMKSSLIGLLQHFSRVALPPPVSELPRELV